MREKKTRRKWWKIPGTVLHYSQTVSQKIPHGAGQKPRDRHQATIHNPN